MDWIALQAAMTRDTAMPQRASRLQALEAVLDGRQYDHLPYAFSEERSAGGEYVPLRQRRPSARTGLCRVVVEDAVSLLFSEGHWPALKATSPATVDGLAAIAKATRLNDVMLEAATRGSVGSVVIRLRALSGKPFVDVLSTACMAPEWEPDDPDVLLRVTERYIVTGSDLAAQGYQILSQQRAARYWFQRTWDDANETWYVPVALSATGAAAVPRIDDERSVNHGLGFVPLVWVRNLPSSRRDGPDGACTFECAIDTVIETDYLLSQGGRALKYASDPTLVIKAGESDGSTPARTGGAANALELPPTGDAKLLEINGASARAVLEHVQVLRACALETMHGNRAHADKLSAATSGRSIELMMSGLIWLADRMRVSYGEGALLDLLRMICAMTAKLETGLSAGGVEHHDLDPDGLELRWAPWMPVMPQDMLTTAQALVTGYAGGVLSQQTAVQTFAGLLNVEDAKEEARQVLVEQAAKASAAAAAAKLQAEAAAAASATVVRSAANEGRTETRQTTA